MSTQTLFLAALEKAAAARGCELVVDREWANTGSLYAVADGGLSPAGARLRFSFQDDGYFRLVPVGDYDPIAVYSTTGTAAFCYDTVEKILAVVLDAIAPSCTSDDPTNHQGDTCPIHEATTDAEALDRLAEFFRLSNWQIRGSGADFIDSLREVVDEVRDLSGDPSQSFLEEYGMDRNGDRL